MSFELTVSPPVLFKATMQLQEPATPVFGNPTTTKRHFYKSDVLL